MSDKIPTSVELLDQMRQALAARAGDSTPVSDYRVATELGISRSNVSEIRRGKNTWGSPTAVKIAEILQVNPAWVLTVIQAERAQNVGVRMIWTAAAKKLASVLIVLLICSGVASPSKASGAVNGYIHYAHYRGGWRSRLLGWLKRFRGLMWLAFWVASMGCAFAPPCSDAVEARAAALTARWNDIHQQHFDVPPIHWAAGSCSRNGDTEGEVLGWQDATVTTGTQRIQYRYFVGTVALTASCAGTMLEVLLDNTLPHELCHVFVDRLYGSDQGHDGLWQVCAAELGIPGTDPYLGGNNEQESPGGSPPSRIR